MRLKSDGKFIEKMTFDFKYDMRNLMNFYPTSQKSENFTLRGSFFKICKVWAKKNTEEFITLNSDAKFE